MAYQKLGFGDLYVQLGFLSYLASHSENALSVLRIDDVLWAKQDPAIPDLPQDE